MHEWMIVGTHGQKQSLSSFISVFHDILRSRGLRNMEATRLCEA